MEAVRRKLKVLGKRYSMEIIALLSEGPRYISQLSEELGAPYATIQNRIGELERVGLVEVVDAVDEASKRAVRLVRGVNFRLEISPRVIRELWMGEAEARIPHRLGISIHPRDDEGLRERRWKPSEKRAIDN